MKILGIYSDLRDSFAKLSETTGIDEHAVPFPGFDGNNESELLSFSHALTKNGLYTTTIGESGHNSHFPTTDMYRRIIVVWEALGKPTYPYSKATVEAILAGRIYPDDVK